MKKVLYFKLFFLIVLSSTLHGQNLVLYELDLCVNNKKDSVAFTSLSDNYILSEHPDSLAIPNLANKEEKDAQYFILNPVYRERFLSKMKISETEILFIYDYSTSVLISLPVKNLNVTARLNVYGANWPYSQSDYMIGFEINNKFLKSSDTYFQYCLVYIGKKSPFVVGQVKPVIWKKIEPEKFPLRALSNKDSTLLHEACSRDYKYSISDNYFYEPGGLQYFVQDFLRIIENYVFAKRLIVIDSKTKETIFEKIYFTGEGGGFTPMNEQWTGRLFKNKSSVIFGFKYHSFGCPFITFLNQMESDLYINCDNRH